MTYFEFVHFSSETTRFKDWLDWIWASANAPLFFSLMRKPRNPAEDVVEEWSDGGVARESSSGTLFELGCNEVDLYLHRPRTSRKPKSLIGNIFQNAWRLIGAFRKAISDKDVREAIAAAEIYKGILKVHYLPRDLAHNPLIFDKEDMSSWIEEGRKNAFNPKYTDIYDYRDDKCGTP
jgi:hypothetical protein